LRRKLVVAIPGGSGVLLNPAAAQNRYRGLRYIAAGVSPAALYLPFYISSYITD
jgi:hypothetical protein